MNLKNLNDLKLKAENGVKSCPLVELLKLENGTTLHQNSLFTFVFPQKETIKLWYYFLQNVLYPFLFTLILSRVESQI